MKPSLEFRLIEDGFDTTKARPVTTNEAASYIIPEMSMGQDANGGLLLFSEAWVGKLVQGPMVVNLPKNIGISANAGYGIKLDDKSVLSASDKPSVSLAISDPTAFTRTKEAWKNHSELRLNAKAESGQPVELFMQLNPLPQGTPISYLSRVHSENAKRELFWKTFETNTGLQLRKRTISSGFGIIDEYSMQSGGITLGVGIDGSTYTVKAEFSKSISKDKLMFALADTNAQRVVGAKTPIKNYEVELYSARPLLSYIGRLIGKDLLNQRHP